MVGQRRSPIAPAEPSGLTPLELGYRMPAEWAAHAATWLAWPHHESDWPGRASAVTWVFCEMIRQLLGSERVRVLVRSSQQKTDALGCLNQSGIAPERVDWVRISTDRSWTRDFLPTFVTRNGARARRALGAVKWRFDGWRRYPNHRLDDAAGVYVATHHAARSWFPEATVLGRRRRVTLEGGAVDVDGEGTLMTTESCLLEGPRARLRSLGRAGAETVLSNYLGVRRVLWLRSGIAGDDTSGHIDDFARFVRPAVVVLCREPRPRDPNHSILEDARERLQAARDERGRKLEIIELPMPEPRAFRGQRLPASYANFYIANGCVLVPTFNDVSDRRALGILGELFPDRRVVGVYAGDLVLGLGTIHCSTQQQPAKVPGR